MAGGELAEVGGEVGHRGGVALERGQGFFRAGVEFAVAEACLGAGDGGMRCKRELGPFVFPEHGDQQQFYGTRGCRKRCVQRSTVNR